MAVHRHLPRSGKVEPAEMFDVGQRQGHLSSRASLRGHDFIYIAVPFLNLPSILQSSLRWQHPWVPKV